MPRIAPLFLICVLLVSQLAGAQETATPSRPAASAETDSVQPSTGDATTSSPAAETIYSGPQVGEPLSPFLVRGVYDDDAGQEIDFVQRADSKPIVLIFVHDVNRPSVALTRVLTTYTHSRAKDGLTTGIVWLDDDATEAERTLQRIRHALAPNVPIGISIDGREGPGSYGLNRNVTLTILVANENTVTANFALVQPSLQSDLPKILTKIVEVVGGEVPRLETLEGMPQMMRGRMQSARAAPNEAVMADLRDRIRPVIQRDATDEEIDTAATAVEAYLENNPAARREVGRIATTIVNSDKLTNYGTARSQAVLRRWKETYGPEFEQARATAESSESDAASRDAPAATTTDEPASSEVTAP
ncbi:MAG: hypothetical protein KDB23_14875 [Planctomycetales bacterium]|nr:hypothetical protein [Planctomycetales bacterium]